MTIIQSADKLLPAFHKDVSKKAMDAMKQNGIEVLTNCRSALPTLPCSEPRDSIPVITITAIFVAVAVAVVILSCRPPPVDLTGAGRCWLWYGQGDGGGEGRSDADGEAEGDRREDRRGEVDEGEEGDPLRLRDLGDGRRRPAAVSEATVSKGSSPSRKENQSDSRKKPKR